MSATTITITDGAEVLTITHKSAKADLALKAGHIRTAVDAAESASLLIGRILVDVKSSGLAVAYLTAKVAAKVNEDGRKSAFASWATDAKGLNLTKSAVSKYNAHATMVDALIADGLAVKSAEGIGQDGAVALGQRTEDAAAAHEVVDSILADGRTVSRAAVLEYTETEDEGVVLDEDEDEDEDGSGPATVPILTAADLVSALVDAAEGDLPVAVDGLTETMIAAAHEVLTSWSVSVANLAKSAA